MSFFDRFLMAVEFIRPKYMLPLFTALTMNLSFVFAPFLNDDYFHKFEEPAAPEFTGETMELTPDYTIVVGENASSAESFAAQRLQYYLKEISGVELSIARDSQAPAEKEIIVGKTNREVDDLFVDRSALGDDGIVIKTVGKKVILSGAEKRGAIYSVYNFLEKYFSCHWFANDFVEIPKAEKLIIPKAIDYSYTPKLIYRNTNWHAQTGLEYKLANGLNNNMSEQYGGGVSYTGHFAHSMNAVVSKDYFETEPEVFALGALTGERTTDQRCLSNPRTLEIAIETVRGMLRDNPNAQIISVTQNDNQNYCVCENCKRIDSEEGSQAGSLLRFVNAIADNVKDDYPNLLIDTFAYQYTRTPPKITTPRDNVIIRLCSIECHFSTPLNSGDSEKNNLFADDIAKWSRISKNLFIWDYTTNFAHYLAPHANLDVLQENMRFFVDNNVKGMFEQGNSTSAIGDGEFANLRCYVLAKLMWNPDEDVDRLVYDFCKAYYGEGYQSVIDFINYIDENSGVGVKVTNWWVTPFPNTLQIIRGTGIYESVKSPAVLRIRIKDVPKIDALWATAKSKAGTAEQLEHCERSEICWRYWKACNCVGEFGKYGDIQANTEFYEDLIRLNIVRLSEWSTDGIHDDNGYLSSCPDLSKTPDKWQRGLSPDAIR